MQYHHYKEEEKKNKGVFENGEEGKVLHSRE